MDIKTHLKIWFGSSDIKMKRIKGLLSGLVVYQLWKELLRLWAGMTPTMLRTMMVEYAMSMVVWDGLLLKVVCGEKRDIGVSVASIAKRTEIGNSNPK